MLNYKTKIGYISKRIDENGKPYDFKLSTHKITKINVGKTKISYKISGFRGTYEEDYITSYEDMEKDVRHGLILTGELFITSDFLQKHLLRVIDDWNTNGTAKGVFDN